jgi:aconitate hydratase
MLAIGAGGLDVAMAMGGHPFVVGMPRIVRVLLTGALPPWCSAKDIVLELLRRLSTSGGVGKIFEYAGPGVATLSVYERGTITNMGAELGATSSVFPSDERTREFLKMHRRERDFVPLAADPDATYDETVDIDLAALEPLIALPHSPDSVVPVREVAGTPLDQVFIGSCTNGSYLDMARVAAILRGKITRRTYRSASPRARARRSFSSLAAANSPTSRSRARGSSRAPAARASASARPRGPAARACARRTGTSRGERARRTPASTSQARKRPRRRPLTAASQIRERSGRTRNPRGRRRFPRTTG